MPYKRPYEAILAARAALDSGEFERKMAERARERDPRFKRCTKCNERKPVESFHKAANGRLGRTNKCKDCAQAYHAAWYAQNREREADKMRKYYAAHAEERREYSRRYRAKKRSERLAKEANNRESDPGGQAA